ncbi:MAG: D-glycero-beta-D-manno-heptose 1-phosphate adenylyltransferase [Chloroflexota bacterium]
MRATDTVRDFRRLRALVIGDAILDSYLEGSAVRLCAEGPVPVVRRTSENRVPGGAANTAANLRALGAEVTFVGVVGDDLPGAMLRDALQQRGIATEGLAADPAVSTLHKIRIQADGQYVVRFDSGLTSASQSEASLIASMEQAFADCDVVAISDYRYGVISPRLIRRLTDLRAHRPVPLIVDSKDLSAWARAPVTVVTPNRLEAQLAVEPNGDFDDTIDLRRVRLLAQGLLRALSAEWIAITLAEAGVLLACRDGTSVHIEAHPVPHPADVGAGDSFAAALTLALAAGTDVETAARIGVAAAGIAVTRPQTAVVQHQELLQRMSLEGREVLPDQAAVLSDLDAYRAGGKRIVFTNGVFDILHAGHVNFLRQAAILGDVLVVGVNSDASARRLKGENRPVNGVRDRQALVAALDAVDHVVIFDEDTPAEIIRRVRPDVHVKGGDYADELLPEAEAVREVGGRIEIVPLTGGFSTTEMIGRIVALALGEPVKVTP